jgi:hypothetical protein
MVQQALLRGAGGFDEGISPVSGQLGTSKPGDLAVTTGGSGLQVSVAAGRAWVKGDSRATQGSYFCYVPTANTVTMPAAHATNPRVDAVVLKVEDADVSGSATQWSLTYQQGTATGGASLSNLTGAPGQSGGPALDPNCLVLAYVLTTATFTGPYVNATHIKDFRYMAYQAGAKVVSSANDSLTSSGSVIKLSATHFDTTKFDDGGLWNATNGRFEIMQAGLYAISGNIAWEFNASGMRAVFLGLNSAGSIANTNSITSFAVTAGASALEMGTPFYAEAELVNGDHLEVGVFQNSGSTINIVGGGSAGEEDGTWWACRLLRAAA